jgi:hypothetical protein
MTDLPRFSLKPLSDEAKARIRAEVRERQERALAALSPKERADSDRVQAIQLALEKADALVAIQAELDPKRLSDLAQDKTWLEANKPDSPTLKRLNRLLENL